MVRGDVNICYCEAVIGGSGEHRGESVASRDEGIQAHGVAVPGSQDTTSGTGSADEVKRVGVAGREEAVGLGWCYVVEFGFLDAYDSGVSSSEGVPNYTALIRVAQTANVPRHN